LFLPVLPDYYRQVKVIVITRILVEFLEIITKITRRFFHGQKTPTTRFDFFFELKIPKRK